MCTSAGACNTTQNCHFFTLSIRVDMLVKSMYLNKTCSPCPALSGCFLEHSYSCHAYTELFFQSWSPSLCMESKREDNSATNFLQKETVSLHLLHIPGDCPFHLCKTVGILNLKPFWKYWSLCFGAGNPSCDEDLQHLEAEGPSTTEDNYIVLTLCILYILDIVIWLHKITTFNCTISFCSLSLSISNRTSKTFSPTQDQLLSTPAIWNTHTNQDSGDKLRVKERTTA